MSTEQNPLSKPLHMEFPDIWELKNGPNPDLLTEYLTWLASDDERLASGVAAMQWYPPGFHGLLIALDKQPGDATHRATLQLNFYHEDYPGDEEPHAHSRDALSSWYAPEGTRQILTRYQVIPDEAPRFRGVPVEERAVIAMNIGDAGNGQRPVYMPKQLGKGLILKRSVSNVASFGSQGFASTEVHHAGFEGKGVAISAHYKGPEEAEALNTFEGFRYVKGLSKDAAAELVETRQKLEERLRVANETDGVRLAPSTTLYPRLDRVTNILVRGKIAPPKVEVSEAMILGALATAEKLTRV